MLTWLPLLIFAVKPELSMQKLSREMDRTCHLFHGKIGYFVKNLSTGETIGLNADTQFPSASTIKTVIMIEVANQIKEGKFMWTDQIRIPEKKLRNLSMWAGHLEEGTSVNIDGLTNLMMNVSDNTAAVMLADRVGVENIENRMMRWGLKDTACTIHEPPTNTRLRTLQKKFANMGVTTPAEMGAVLERLYRGTAVQNRAASERMLRIMSHQYWDDFFASQIPYSTIICSKVGALERSRSDTAIVYGPTPYLITAYTDDSLDRSWGIHCEGHDTLRTLSRLAWQYLEPKHPYSPPKGADKWFPTGAGVEDS